MAYDVVGSVIVFHGDIGREKALGLLERHKNVRTVVKKVGVVSGEFRVPRVKWVAGRKCFSTVHVENGCKFRVRVGSVYFSPRLAGERLRVASLVGRGERVVDLFAGVGPFIVLIAKRVPSVDAWAVEKNPVACELLRENVVLNKVSVKVLCGDAGEVGLPSDVDRWILNLPGKSFEFLDRVFKFSSKGAVVHFYAFSDGRWSDLFEPHLERIREFGRVEVLGKRRVGVVGVRQYRVVIDFRIV